MADGNPKDLFQWVKPLSVNDKIRGALNPAKCLTEAAQIRTQADRISAAARELEGGEKGKDGVMPVLGGVKGTFGPMEGGYRGISGMLAGLANKAGLTSSRCPRPGLTRSPFLAQPRSCRHACGIELLQSTTELISLAMSTIDALLQ
jgi:hypothetical protein